MIESVALSTAIAIQRQKQTSTFPPAIVWSAVISFLIHSTYIISVERKQWKWDFEQIYTGYFSRERSLFSLKLRKSSFYPSIRYQAFSVSDFLGAVGGLMGLIAGISVFSIIEFTLTIMRCLRFARDSNVTPEAVQRPRPRRRFLVNHDHLFYHLGQNFAEFLKESSIHGVRYTIDKKLKVWERICSAIIVCISVTFCSILIIESLDHLQSNSVSVALGEKIWNVEDVRCLQI